MVKWDFKMLSNNHIISFFTRKPMLLGCLFEAEKYKVVHMPHWEPMFLAFDSKKIKY